MIEQPRIDSRQRRRLVKESMCGSDHPMLGSVGPVEIWNDTAVLMTTVDETILLVNRKSWVVDRQATRVEPRDPTW